LETNIDIKLYIPFFRKVSLFKNLDDEQISKVCSSMQISNVEQDTVITTEGAQEDTIFILIEGEVEISKRLVIPMDVTPEDRHEKSLIVLSEKQYPFFGEMALFQEIPERSASVKAKKPCKLAVFQKNNLLDIFDTNSEIGSTIYKNIATELVKRLQKANKDILKLTTAFTLALEG